MKNKFIYIRFIVLILLVVLLTITAYADEYVQQENDYITENINALNIVLDKKGTFWYMPHQIPLTFLSNEDKNSIFKYKLYSEIDLELKDTRENYQIVWDYWYYKTENATGVAGLMGNIRVESNFNANNLQGIYEQHFGMSDESYTSAVDNGTYTNFIYDNAGYGLVQCTYWKMKERLLNFAQESKTSVGDIYMQLDFLYNELSYFYPVCFNVISNANSIGESSNSVLMEFERPSDQSIAVQNERTKYGNTFYNSCIERCDILDSIKKDIKQQISTATDRIEVLNINYTLQSQWSSFLTDFYKQKKSPV